ncbi:MAG: hypothetical protein LBB88_02155 [Planctomycetaceae bacterium]|nr:hypothetical protein [Planctomycetaceae bacterium]
MNGYDNFLGGLRGHWGRWGHWGRSCLISGINGSGKETKFKEKNFSFLKAVVFC